MATSTTGATAITAIRADYSDHNDYIFPRDNINYYFTLHTQHLNNERQLLPQRNHHTTLTKRPQLGIVNLLLLLYLDYFNASYFICVRASSSL